MEVSNTECIIHGGMEISSTIFHEQLCDFTRFLIQLLFSFLCSPFARCIKFALFNDYRCFLLLVERGN